MKFTVNLQSTVTHQTAKQACGCQILQHILWGVTAGTAYTGVQDTVFLPKYIAFI